MKKTAIILIIMSFAIFAKAQTPDISGFARNYTGALYENGDFTILQNTFNSVLYELAWAF